MPAGMKDHMHELQQTLLYDDCYLPWMAQEFGPLTMNPQLIANQGDPEPVRDGFSRQVGDDPHAWEAHPGDTLAYLFPDQAHVDEVTLTLDSDLAKRIAHSWNANRLRCIYQIPPVMPKTFRIEGLSHGRMADACKRGEEPPARRAPDA